MRFQQILALTGAYVAGDVLHGAIEFTSPNPNGVLYLLSLSDSEKKNAEIDLFIFRQALAGTYTDNAAPTNAAADSRNAIVQTLLSSDYREFNAHSIATKTGKAILRLEPNDRFFIVPVIKQAITWASADSLTLNAELL